MALSEPKRKRITRRAYTILKYYAEEYGVGSGSSKTFGSVLLSLVEQCPTWEQLQHSDDSEAKMAESIARALLPEVRVMVEEQLTVSLENCEKELEWLRDAEGPLRERISFARRQAARQTFIDSLNAEPPPSIGSLRIAIAPDGTPSLPDTDLCIPADKAFEVGGVLALAHSLLHDHASPQNYEEVFKDIIRFLGAVMPEYAGGEATTQGLVHRMLHCLDGFAHTIKRKQIEKIKRRDKLEKKLRALDSAVLRTEVQEE